MYSGLFAGTPYGHFYGTSDGPAPVQYLQIYQDDIQYANDHPSLRPSCSMRANGSSPRLTSGDHETGCRAR